MKIVAALIAGIVLGITPMAFAGIQQAYWKKTGRTYSCDGGPISVFCKETNWKPGYKVAIIPGSIIVSFGSHVVFGCDRGVTPAYNCQSFVPAP